MGCYCWAVTASVGSLRAASPLGTDSAHYRDGSPRFRLGIPRRVVHKSRGVRAGGAESWVITVVAHSDPNHQPPANPTDPTLAKQIFANAVHAVSGD